MELMKAIKENQFVLLTSLHHNPRTFSLYMMGKQPSRSPGTGSWKGVRAQTYRRVGAENDASVSSTVRSEYDWISFLSYNYRQFSAAKHRKRTISRCYFEELESESSNKSTTFLHSLAIENKPITVQNKSVRNIRFYNHWCNHQLSNRANCGPAFSFSFLHIWNTAKFAASHIIWK